MTFNPLDVETPAQREAAALAADYGLAAHGLVDLRRVYWNLPVEALYEEIAFRGEGRLARGGSLVVATGAHTSRSAYDKFVVRDAVSEEHVWWSEYNRPLAAESFDALYARLAGYLQGRDVFVQDCVANADPDYALPLRVVTERAWHSLFARTMFAPLGSREAYRCHVPRLAVVCAPGFRGFEPADGTRSSTFVVLDLERGLCVIGGTEYAGEIKKAVFSVLNHLLPLQGVLSMHCSVNVGADGASALFFGLSGTGKTTLSADPARLLVGDDEHGWGEDGVFNVENGCYAKAIRLSASAEPAIWAAAHRFGTLLENVVLDPATRAVDLDDDRLTENTRASYTLAALGNSVPERRAGHPRDVVLLTCDAQGVLPPIARLTPDQALYHFVSGYTSKVAGTEAGTGVDPEITFSTCFGAPFVLHHPAVYADLLKRKIERHGSRCWLVNTGWVGGPFGVGSRISIAHTRRLVEAALRGELDEVAYRVDELFGFEVPESCPGIPPGMLHPERAWPSEEAYRDRYRQLAARYVGNFRRLADECPPELAEAGPRLEEVPSRGR